jgi:sugar phosphate isomerase/epimerase
MNTLKRFLSRGLATVVLASVTSLVGYAEPVIPDEFKTGGFAIGAQAYTFNRFTVFEAIEKTAEARGKVIEFFPGQKLSKAEPSVTFSHDSPVAVLEVVKAKLAEHKIMAVNYGVVGIPNDEAGARKIFEFAKKMGMRAVTTESTESIDVIEKLVKEFDIAVGYHNHPRQPNNPNYKVWDPYYILSLVKDRDPRIGAAADTGHWCTTGLNPAYALRILKGRIISAHLKDKNVFGPGHDIPYGQGVANIKECLDELKSQGFQGNISIEYEYNWEDSVPEVGACILYVRDYGQK